MTITSRSDKGTSRVSSISIRATKFSRAGGIAILLAAILAMPWGVSYAARTNYVDDSVTVEGIAANVKDSAAGGGASLDGGGFDGKFDGVFPMTRNTWLLGGTGYEHINTSQDGVASGLNRTHVNFGFISRLSEEAQGFIRVVGLNEELRSCPPDGCSVGSRSATKLGGGLDFGFRLEWGKSWTTILDLEADRLSDAGNGSSVDVFGGLFQAEYRPLLHLGIVSDFNYRRYQAEGGSGSSLTLLSVNVGLAVHF